MKEQDQAEKDRLMRRRESLEEWLVDWNRRNPAKEAGTDDDN